MCYLMLKINIIELNYDLSPIFQNKQAKQHFLQNIYVKLRFLCKFI